MRTVFLLGVAAGSLLLAGHARAQDPQPRLDYGTPAATDVRVYTGYPDRVPSEVEYRRVGGAYDAEGRWTGAWDGSGAVETRPVGGTYDAQGRWTGSWDGTYEAPGGRVYDGRYEGSVARAGTSYPPPPPAGAYYGGNGGYDPRYDEEMERRCGRGGTVGGAVVGGVVGGIAGNRIAGRGDRTEGTIIGGTLGAIAGGAIGSEADRKRCESWWASRGGYYYGAPPGAAIYRQGGYGYGYGYYTPGVVVTTIITTGAPVVTETVETSTRTYYETVPVKKKRYVAKRKWKPKPKPRCVC